MEDTLSFYLGSVLIELIELGCVRHYWPRLIENTLLVLAHCVLEMSVFNLRNFAAVDFASLVLVLRIKSTNVDLGILRHG